LKPENIFLDRFYNLKISKFGLGTFLKTQNNDEDLLRDFCGTRSYMAPEIFLKNPYDGRKADIFSSGVILFIIFIG
jgi:5'-AMP-activated protein kinase catalytic alpha subunit